MTNKIKVGFLSEIDLHDITQLSGTSYNLRRVLEEKGFEVICIDNLEKGFHFITFIQKIKAKIYRRFAGINFRPDWTNAGSKILAKRALKKIRKNKPDILFTWSTPVLSHLEVDMPKILYTDATFHLMLDFYGNFSNFSEKTRQAANELARRAFHNADRLLFSSHWAADSAVEDYGIPRSRVHVVTLGANIEVDHDADIIEKLIDEKSGKPIHLLFMGIDWNRKGGPKALEIARYIKEKGNDVYLQLVGSRPPEGENFPDYVMNHGFISKARPEGRKLLDDIFRKTHFLVLPTRADCTPMVYAELNAYGIPAVTHEVGGIPSVVQNETNGLIFSPDSTTEEMAEKILAVFLNPEKYRHLSLSSFRTYKEKLNWNQTGEKLSEHIHVVMTNKKKVNFQPEK